MRFSCFYILHSASSGLIAVCVCVCDGAGQLPGWHMQQMLLIRVRFRRAMLCVFADFGTSFFIFHVDLSQLSGSQWIKSFVWFYPVGVCVCVCVWTCFCINESQSGRKTSSSVPCPCKQWCCPAVSSNKSSTVLCMDLTVFSCWFKNMPFCDYIWLQSGYDLTPAQCHPFLPNCRASFSVSTSWHLQQPYSLLALNSYFMSSLSCSEVNPWWLCPSLLSIISLHESLSHLSHT